MSILYRFEVEHNGQYDGIYQVIDPLMLSYYLESLGLLPCHTVYTSKSITFFFTEKGLKEYALCLEEIFTCEELINYFYENRFTLMGLRILKPDWKPLYEDEFQVCYPYELAQNCFEGFKPIKSLKDWDNFISFSS